MYIYFSTLHLVTLKSPVILSGVERLFLSLSYGNKFTYSFDNKFVSITTVLLRLRLG